MLFEVDAYILSLFTKFSHWFQRLTGKTNFWWAKLASFWLALLFPSMLFSFKIKIWNAPSIILISVVSIIDLGYLAWNCKLLDSVDEWYREGNVTLHLSSLKWRNSSGIITMMLYTPLTIYFLNNVMMDK